jgi:hypothetical protein
MGHELGHYVLNHIYKWIAAMSLLLLAGFLFTQWAMTALLARFGDRFGLRGVSDVASFPLLVALMSVFAFATTPITNTLIRTQEVEADRFGLNLAREPYGACRGRPEADEYRQARSDAARGVHLLRPSQHALSHPRRHALARGDGHAVTAPVAAKAVRQERLTSTRREVRRDVAHRPGDVVVLLADRCDVVQCSARRFFALEARDDPGRQVLRGEAAAGRGDVAGSEERLVEHLDAGS